jgi:hypothetical protein
MLLLSQMFCFKVHFSSPLAAASSFSGGKINEQATNPSFCFVVFLPHSRARLIVWGNFSRRFLCRFEIEFIGFGLELLPERGQRVITPELNNGDVVQTQKMLTRFLGHYARVWGLSWNRKQSEKCE